ncbi:hypothetical protein KCU92_g10166, partial [Aureobasidium melanogenum]
MEGAKKFEQSHHIGPMVQAASDPTMECDKSLRQGTNKNKVSDDEWHQEMAKKVAYMRRLVEEAREKLARGKRLKVSAKEADRLLNEFEDDVNFIDTL